jgi:hypothetical protein
VADLAREALVVAAQAEELVHQVLRQPLEIRVIRIARAASALLAGLEGG